MTLAPLFTHSSPGTGLDFWVWWGMVLAEKIDIKLVVYEASYLGDFQQYEHVLNRGTNLVFGGAGFV